MKKTKADATLVLRLRNDAHCRHALLWGLLQGALNGQKRHNRDIQKESAAKGDFAAALRHEQFGNCLDYVDGIMMSLLNLHGKPDHTFMFGYTPDVPRQNCGVPRKLKRAIMAFCREMGAVACPASKA